MGLDVTRFRSRLYRHLMCSICGGVLEGPRHCPAEHYFCFECLLERVRHAKGCPECPEDAPPVSEQQLKPCNDVIPLIVANLLITCGNRERGCRSVVKLCQLEEHSASCDYAEDEVTTV